MPRIGWAAVVVIAIVAGLSASASQAAQPRRCATNDRFLQQLTAVGVTCPGARRIAFAWARSSRCIPAGDGSLQDRARPCVVRGFACSPRRAEIGVRMTCRSAGRVVRFLDFQT